MAERFRFKIRMRTCPACCGLLAPGGWPPDTSSLKAARQWQQTFGDWRYAKCLSCPHAFGWTEISEPLSTLVVSRG